MDLRDFLTDRYALRHQNAGPKTIAQYLIAVNLFGTHLGREPLVDDLLPDTVLRFLRWLHDSGRAPRTVNSKRQALLTLWRDAFRDGKTVTRAPDNGDVPRLTEPRRVPVAWTVDEMRRLKRACVAAPRIPRFDPQRDGRHWLALILVMWETGHRLNSLLTVQRSAIDERGVLRVPAELTKTYTEMVDELSPETLAAVAAMPDHPMLFPWPFSRRQIWVRFEKDVLIPAGLPFDRLRKFHCIRRSSASHVCAAAGEYAAQQHMGHRSVAVTIKSYLDPTIAFQRMSAAKVLPKL